MSVCTALENPRESSTCTNHLAGYPGGNSGLNQACLIVPASICAANHSRSCRLISPCDSGRSLKSTARQISIEPRTAIQFASAGMAAISSGTPLRKRSASTVLCAFDTMLKISCPTPQGEALRHHAAAAVYPVAGIAITCPPARMERPLAISAVPTHVLQHVDALTSGSQGFCALRRKVRRC